MTSLITRREALAMRGIAILAIVLHNYTHWLGPMVKENEYTFSWHNSERLFAEISHPSWNIIAHLLSFFGHYGVPVFVFLSAYGLVMKYEGGNPRNGTTGSTVKDEGAWTFVKKHFMKLWIMMAVGYSAFILTDYMTPGPYRYTFWNVVGQLGLFSNLYADPDHAIWPGPYWYFGLTMQLYLVYRFMLYPGKMSLSGLLPNRRHKSIPVILAAGCIAVQLSFEPLSAELNWFRYNCFGNLPVFAMGILYARTRKRMEKPRLQELPWAISALAVVVMSSADFVLWTFAPFFVCIGTIKLVRALPDALLRPLAWTGGISAAMFVCHPVTRKVIIPISRHGEIYAGLLLYILATIILAVLFKKATDIVSENINKS
ncbi:MAG: acyltransferase [Bacteroidales bacterium]|nr:acyltransferase [Bacteroidales bacterium]MCM1146914.1 acyltransferase [Bacteroidales bacterium]MCM1205588.1 acyltransferase [Bacillota bacterium]MCM1510301.1 acyltransferase [Clostridium sp.]